jgi:hypothetical protein
VPSTKRRRPAAEIPANGPSADWLPGLISSRTKSKRPENQAFGKGRPRPDRGGEARIQGAILQFIRTVAPDVLTFHIPNGGLRDKREAAKLRWQGVTAGIPDLCLLAPVHRVFFIEVKTATGRLSSDQLDIHGWLTTLGIPCAVCRSIDDCRRALAAWNIETREARR